MIPSKAQIAYGVYGAWRLAHLDKRGLTCFDDSDQGFIRSFFAAVLVLPAYALITIINYRGAVFGVSATHALVIELLSYVAAWALWPVITYPLCQALDRGRQYFRYIVAYNWSFVIVMAVALPVTLLGYAGVLPGQAGHAANWIVYLGALIYAGVIAKLALDITAGAAVGLVVLDSILSLILQSMTSGAILAPSAG